MTNLFVEHPAIAFSVLTYWRRRGPTACMYERKAASKFRVPAPLPSQTSPCSPRVNDDDDAVSVDDDGKAESTDARTRCDQGFAQDQAPVRWRRNHV